MGAGRDWSDLIERDRELADLHRAVGGLAGAVGAVVLVEGPAGSGKSRLLSALADMGTRAAVETAGARAVDLDASLPFAVARRLLEPSLRSASRRPGGVPRGERALRALSTVIPGSSAMLAERGAALVHAVVEGAEALVEVLGPLVVAVDDVQWADAPSLQLLVYLADRARELPIVLAVGLRRGELDAESVARFRTAAGVTVIRPRELSPEGVSLLVERRLPGATLEVAAACRRVTGGNPFLLNELIAAVEAAGIATSPNVGARIEQLTPRTVVDGVLVRLGRLPYGAAELARAAAVLGDGARLRHAARLAGMAPAAAAEVADALVEADIIEGEDPLSFRHPLIAAAVLGDLGPFTRSELHRRAAEVLTGEGLPERAAAHLLNATATGDADVVGRLREAAAGALERGDARSARRFLLRALDEPPETGRRAELLIELARAESALGEPQALGHMDEAIASIEDPERAAFALRGLARLHYARSEYATATRLAERALGLAREESTSRERLHATWLLCASMNPETAVVVGGLLDAMRAGPLPDDPESQAILALYLIVGYGDPADAARLAGSAIDGDMRINDDGLGLAFEFGLGALLYSGALRELQATATRALEWANDRSSIMAAASAAGWRGLARLQLADLDGAEADAATALLPWRYGWVANTPQAYALLARVRIERGDRGGARESIEAAAGIELPHPPYRYADGLVRMAAGDCAGAFKALLIAGNLLESLWKVETPAVLPWRSTAALAALRAGMRREAESLAARELELARRTGVPSVLALALRADGLVAGGERSVALLREALDILVGTDDALETVRTHVELGAALRRMGARAGARAELAAARDAAERLGLAALAARAEEEHKASGGRPRRTRLSGVASLTPSERRIAERAAGGATNRQIAADLFLTAKTVEWHIGNVFRKLGVSSRRELAQALRTEPETQPAGR